MQTKTSTSARASPTRAATRPVTRPAIAPLLIFLLTALLCGWYLWSAPLDAEDAFSLGGVSSLRLQGLYGAETDAEGRGYRWTDGAGAIRLPAQGPGPHLLDVTLAAPRPTAATVPITLTWNGAPLARLDQSPGDRRYALLIPAGDVRWGDNSLGLASPTFHPPGGDGRALGVAVFEVVWRSADVPAWLPLAQAAAIAGAATALYLLLRRAGIPTGASLLALALFLAILLSMRHSDPRFAERWGALLLTGGLGLLAAAALLVVRPQPGARPLPWRPWLRLHWPAFVGYVALTALMHLPILARLTTHIPGHPGDAFEYLWKLQLFADSLVGGHQSPTFLPGLMYPEGFELANSEITPANTLLGIPITLLLGPIASFNALNLASYALSGFFTYLLVHRLGARRLAAFVGGIVFAFTVRRYYQMTSGHLPLVPTQYLPLALYGLEGLLTRRRSWDAFVTAVGLALATWASLYYGTTLAVFMVAYALLRTGLRGLPGLLAHGWRAMALAAVVLLALTLPFAQPYLDIRAEGSSLRHTLVQLEVHSAKPRDYLTTNPYHPLFGAWARQFHRNDGGEHVVTLGYSVIALIVLGLALARPRRLTLALALLMAVTFVLTLGPWLWLPGGGRLPLPALFIYEHVPILNGIRVWNRVVLYIVLCAAILAGLALTALPRRGYYLGVALAAGLLLFELASAPPRFTTAGPREVDLWLREQPGRGAVIELPPTPSGSDVFYASFHQKPSNMWYGTFDPPLYSESWAAIHSFPSRRALQVLQRWQTDYVVVDEGALAALDPDWQTGIAELTELQLVYSQGGLRVYRLDR